MDSLGNILQPSRYSAPSEIQKLKDYVKLKYQADINVELTPRQVNLIVPSSALAGTLRHEMRQLQSMIGKDKKLVIRISS